jgi:hypothetical protein
MHERVFDSELLSTNPFDLFESWTLVSELYRLAIVLRLYRLNLISG